ncbi:MAG: hypothetical protein ACOCZB_09440, partial [Spirochaetota bacterium]
HLDAVAGGHLVLSEHDDPLMISLAGVDLDSPEELIPVTVQPIPQDQRITIVTPPGFATQIEEMGKVVVRVSNLSESASILEALDRMVELTQDIDALRDGWKLLFLVRDTKGRKWPDEKFFAEAVRVHGAGERIRRIIDNFVAYPDADQLYIHTEATALCYAVNALALSDDQWIDTALSYLAVMDFEHDVYCRETLIPNLIATYGETASGPRVRIGVAMTDDYEAAELYLFNEFRNPDSSFRKWFDAGGAAEIPRIVEELSVLGLRERRLFDGGAEEIEELQSAVEGELATAVSAGGLDPDLLGWNYLKHAENPDAGTDLAGNDMSGYEEAYLRLLAFAGIANMLTFDILPDDVHVAIRGVEDPRVTALLPDPIDFSKIGGLMHRVENESFLRLPGLMMVGGMEFVIDYLTSTRIAPEDVEAMRRESWGMDPADLVLNLPVMFADRLEEVLFFLQPPFHSTSRSAWSAWLTRMQSQAALEGLTAGMLQQLLSFAIKLSRLQSKVDFLVEYEVEEFLQAVRAAVKKSADSPRTPPAFEGFVRIDADGKATPR